MRYKQQYKHWILLIGLSISLTATCYLYFLLHNDLKEDHNNTLTLQTTHINKTIAHSTTILNSVERFYASSEYVSEREFKIFTRSLLKNVSAIDGLLYAPIIERSQVKDFVNDTRSRGKTGFKIFSFNQQDYQPNHRTIPILYLQSIQDFSHFIGLDLATEPDLEDVLNIDHDKLKVKASWPFELENPDKRIQKYFALAQPVTQSNSLVGFAIIIMDVEKMLAQDSSQSQLTLLSHVDNPPQVESGVGKSQYKRTFNILDKQWTIILTPPPGEQWNIHLIVFITLMAGIALTALTTSLSHRLIKREREMVNIVQAHGDQISLLESQLSEQQHELLKAEENASMSALASGLSHELRTPLGVIKVAITSLTSLSQEFSQLFRNNRLTKQFMNDYESSASQAILLIKSNSDRLVGMVDSYQNVLSDKAHADQRVFNVRDYIQEVLFTLNPIIRKTSHIIKVDCDSKILINSYPGAFAQIIINLINNSLLHAFDDNESGEMAIKVRHIDGVVTLEYSDNGKGMNKEQLDKIWKPYYTTKRNDGGTGLGLYIVKTMVKDLLNGEIKCTSALDSGVKFSLTFTPETIK